MAAYPYYLGDIAERSGRPQDAVGYFNRAVELDPYFTRAHVRLYKLDPNRINP